MNKKGQFDVARKTIYWTIAAFVVTVVIFAYALVVASYINNLSKVPPEVHAELIALRFTNLPECFAYHYQETNKVFPGVIDFTKFYNPQFLTCYDPQDGLMQYNFRLKLATLGNEITTNNYFNKDDFTIFKEVLVRKDGELLKDQLLIYVQEERRK